VLTGSTDYVGWIAMLKILAKLSGYTGRYAGLLYLICLMYMLAMLAQEAEYAC
jgi:hypothetical protein